MTQLPTWNQLLVFCRFALYKNATILQEFPEPEQINWEDLLQLAARHRVRPLLYKGLLAWENEVPSEILDNLKLTTQKIAFDNLNYTRELLRLIPLFSAEGIEIVPYKGSLLAQKAYGELGIREVSDIDFLFDLKDFHAIKRVLETQEYKPVKTYPKHFEKHFFRQGCEYGFIYYRNGKRVFLVEPHWSLGFKRQQIDIRYGDLKDLLIQQTWFGAEIQCFSNEGILFSTCLHHGGKDSWLVLKYVCDIAMIVHQMGEQIDWNFLLRKAEEMKVSNIILLGLGMAKSVFGVHLPEEILQKLEQRSIKRAIEKTSKNILGDTSIRTDNLKGYFHSLWFHLSLRKQYSTKLKVLYYHFLDLIEPNLNDVMEQERLPYWRLLLNKPFRLIKNIKL